MPVEIFVADVPAVQTYQLAAALALAGEVGMSNELDEVARALFNGSIPAIWRKLAPDTLKSLGNWMEHFAHRFQQYTGWVNEGEPAVMWLSGKIK